MMLMRRMMMLMVMMLMRMRLHWSCLGAEHGHDSIPLIRFDVDGFRFRTDFGFRFGCSIPISQ
eukprot:3824539-Pyramimonas_sp.AAC.1